MSLVVGADFKGVYKISTDNYSQLDNYIEQFEQLYIRMILCDSNAVSMTDLNTMDQKYLDLWNGVTYEIDNEKYINSGMKKAILGFIYFHYVSDNFTNTSVGNVTNQAENSSNKDNGQNAQIAINRFNTSVLQVGNDVNKFLEAYYKIETIVTGYAVLAPTSYRILIPTTKYLSKDDTVTINGIDYNADDLVEDVSIDITAEIGMIFTGYDVTWYPFNKCKCNNIEMITI